MGPSLRQTGRRGTEVNEVQVEEWKGEKISV